MEYKLSNWSVVSMINDPYLAPECNPICLMGFRDSEETEIRTSRIVAAEGKRVTTKSGNVYILQNVDPDYVAFLHTQNIVFDPNNPIRFT